MELRYAGAILRSWIGGKAKAELRFAAKILSLLGERGGLSSFLCVCPVLPL